MAITFNQLMTNTVSNNLINYNPVDQLAYRQEQFTEFKASPEYFMMPAENKKLAERNFMFNSFKGYSPDELEQAGNIRAADYARQLEAVKSGSVVPLNVLDGFIDTFKNSLTGKVLIGAGNMVSQGTLTEHIYDDDLAKQFKEVRDQAFSAYDVEGIKDYKLGKGLGLVGGIAADIAGTSKLYGAVTAPGLLVKPLTSGGMSKILANASEYTAKQLGAQMTPYWFGQLAIETLGFQVEEGVADLVTGKMEQDGGFNSWLQTNFKSNLARGFGYFLVGEAMGAGLGSMLKMYSKTFTGKGLRNGTIRQLQKLGPDELQDLLLKEVISSDLPDAERIALRALEQTNPDALHNIEKIKRELKFLEVIEDSPDAQFAYSMSRNFDIDFTKDGDKYTVNTFKGIEIGKTFEDQNALLGYIAKEDKVLRNQLFDSSFEALNAGKTPSFSIEMKGGGQIESVSGTYQALVRTLAPNDFRMRADNIDSFIKNAVPNSDIKPQIVLREDFFKNVPSYEKGKIYAPTVMDTQAKQGTFIKSLRDQMKVNFNLDDIKTVNLKSYLENLGTYNKYSISWMEQILGKGQVVKKNNKIFINTPDGSVKEFINETEAGRYVHSAIIDEKLLNKHLAQEYGYRLKVEENGAYTVYNKGRNTTEVIAQESTISKLLTDNPSLMPKKPITTAPNFLRFSNEGVNFEQQIGRGGLKPVTDKLKEYANTSKLLNEEGVLKRSNFEIKLNNVTEDYIARLPNGLEREFDNLAAAESWAGQDWNSIKPILEDLRELGYDVVPNKAGWIAYDLAGNRTSIASREGVLDFYKNMQAVKNINPIDGFDQEISRGLGKNIDDQIDELRNGIIGRGAPQKAKAAKSGQSTDFLSKLLTPVKQSAARFGYKTDVDPLLTDYVAANRLYEGKDVQTKAWVASLFSGFDTYEKESLGKILAEEKGFNFETLGEQLKKFDLPNDPKYADLLNNVRSYFDRMGPVAGVPRGDYITNYLPRFKTVKYEDILSNQTDHKYLYSQYLQGDTPSNMDPFMRKMRKEDYTGMQEDNLQDIMNSYGTIAWRSAYLEGFDKRTGDLIDKLDAESANPDLLLQLKSFKERMVGRSYDESSIELAQRHHHNAINAEKIMSNKFLKKVLSVQQRSNIAGWAKKSNTASGAKALMTSALMAFKVRMPVRNMAQIWTHLGAIYDNPEILRAFKQASDNPEQIYKEMLEKGIINPRQGRNSGQLLSWLRNTNQVGLDWHQNSDDFTRIIGYQAAKQRFSAAYNGLKTGKLDLDGFHRTAGSWALDETDQIKIGEFLKQGKIMEAETVLQSRVVEKCFFDYSSGAKPLGQNKAVASLFMQYSTFPLQSIQLWSNSFLKGAKRNPKESLASVARVTANIAGLSVLFSEMIGYSNTPISFFNYMMFTGGPAAGSIADSVNILGQQSTLGQKVKPLIQANAPTYTPFWGATRALRKSVNALVDGEEIESLRYLLGGSGRDQDSVLDFANDNFNI